MSNFKTVIENLRTCDWKNRETLIDALSDLTELINEYTMEEKEHLMVLDTLEQLSRKLEATGLKPSPECYDYQNIMQQLVAESQMDITYEGEYHLPAYPFAYLYEIYGAELMYCHQDDKAQEVLQKSLDWNPVNTSVLRSCAVSRILS